MLNILTFSTLYPNAVTPHHGIFTATTLRQQLRTGDVRATVVAPVPWFPSGAPLFGRYAGYARVPREEEHGGVRVLHPRYPHPPGIGMYLAPLALARAARQTVARLTADGNDFDLIDAHYFYPDGVAAVMLGRALGKPVTIKALGSDINLLARSRWPLRQMRWAARHCAPPGRGRAGALYRRAGAGGLARLVFGRRCPGARLQPRRLGQRPARSDGLRHAGAGQPRGRHCRSADLPRRRPAVAR